MSETNTNLPAENSNVEKSAAEISAEVGRKELEKIYDSQKKELRKKIAEAEAALAKETEEVEDDYVKQIAIDPNLLTEEETQEYFEHLAKERLQKRKEIETLQAHENELEIDYEDLKTEPKVDMLMDYAKTVNHSININSTLMKMLFDYFNYLNDNKSYQEKAKIMVDCFLDEKGLFMDSFPHNTNMDYFASSIMVDFKKIIRVTVTIKKYFSKMDNAFVHQLCFCSEGKTYLNPDYLGKKILFNAIAHSNIKGSYITMGPGSIMWKVEKLERRGFEDIFLPQSIMEDLNLYTKHSDKTGKLLRYLMIGNPGTGKTESTLAIANYLKDRKVTVIKTAVCEALKDKIELAELLAPSIIIFDDIDLSLGSRKKGQFSSGLGQFLDVLDGTEKVRKDVGIIATTNSLELLDMAAQRPGRFDKMLAFNSLTRGNIKNIILKSLKRNFEIETGALEALPFIDLSVIEAYFKARVTGAHIYNSTKMLKLRVDTLELENITPEWVVSEIELELNTIKEIRKTNFLQDTMSGGGSSEIGFMKNVEEDEEECDEAAEAGPVTSDMTFNTKSQEEDKGYSFREDGTASAEESTSSSL